VERAGEAAEIGLKMHPHMLRHACGHVLANKGLILGLFSFTLAMRRIVFETYGTDRNVPQI
jgi:integrase